MSEALQRAADELRAAWPGAEVRRVADWFDVLALVAGGNLVALVNVESRPCEASVSGVVRTATTPVAAVRAALDAAEADARRTLAAIEALRGAVEAP